MLWMRAAAPTVALRTQVGLPEGLLQRVVDGTLDLAVVYAPRYLPGLKVEMIFEERLVLATTDPAVTDVRDSDYVYVDWGSEFARHHQMSFPGVGSPGLFVDLGPLALDYVLQAGGIGYFRQRALRPHLAAGRLHLVPNAPEFLYPVYAVRAADGDDEALMATALRGLRETAAD